METIDIKEMLNYFKNKISLIILITLLIGIVGCLYGIFIEVPLYKSSFQSVHFQVLLIPYFCFLKFLFLLST